MRAVDFYLHHSHSQVSIGIAVALIFESQQPNWNLLMTHNLESHHQISDKVE